MPKSIYPIQVRIFNNPRYGAATGPGRANMKVFNGSVCIKGQDMHIDYAQIDQLHHSCDLNGSVVVCMLQGIAAQHLGFKPGHEADFVAGQLKVLHPAQCYLPGGIVLNTKTKELFIYVADAEHDEVIMWDRFSFYARRVDKGDRKLPDYYGTNEREGSAPITAATVAKANGMLSQLGK